MAEGRSPHPCFFVFFFSAGALFDIHEKDKKKIQQIVFVISLCQSALEEGGPSSSSSSLTRTVEKFSLPAKSPKSRWERSFLWVSFFAGKKYFFPQKKVFPGFCVSFFFFFANAAAETQTEEQRPFLLFCLPWTNLGEIVIPKLETRNWIRPQGLLFAPPPFFFAKKN